MINIIHLWKEQLCLSLKFIAFLSDGFFIRKCLSTPVLKTSVFKKSDFSHVRNARYIIQRVYSDSVLIRIGNATHRLTASIKSCHLLYPRAIQLLFGMHTLLNYDAMFPHYSSFIQTVSLIRMLSYERQLVPSLLE